MTTASTLISRKAYLRLRMIGAMLRTRSGDEQQVALVVSTTWRRKHSTVAEVDVKSSPTLWSTTSWLTVTSRRRRVSLEATRTEEERAHNGVSGEKSIMTTGIREIVVEVHNVTAETAMTGDTSPNDANEAVVLIVVAIAHGIGVETGMGGMAEIGGAEMGNH